MHILIANNTLIPALQYGGTERVIWWLGKELTKRGHKVTYLVKKGSVCDFADVHYYNSQQSINSQIPDDVDLIHMHFVTDEVFSRPMVTTVHGNPAFGTALPLNSVFVSRNHAERYGSQHFVYNGLDFSDYGDPGLDNSRSYFHFLGKAAWRIKNLRGAIQIAKGAHEKLVVIGGHRLNFKMGFRFTPNLDVRFKGMVGSEKKNELLRHSKGLIFPVLWDEPFGLAIIESMYFGCPVFGTPYGSLPELVTSETGFLSNRKDELSNAIKNSTFQPQKCHEYALTNFNAEKMTLNYLNYYELVLNGNTLNDIPPTLQKQQIEKFLPFF